MLLTVHELIIGVLALSLIYWIIEATRCHQKKEFYQESYYKVAAKMAGVKSALYDAETKLKKHTDKNKD